MDEEEIDVWCVSPAIESDGDFVMFDDPDEALAYMQTVAEYVIENLLCGDEASIDVWCKTMTRKEFDGD